MYKNNFCKAEGWGIWGWVWTCNGNISTSGSQKGWEIRGCVCCVCGSFRRCKRGRLDFVVAELADDLAGIVAAPRRAGIARSPVQIGAALGRASLRRRRRLQRRRSWWDAAAAARQHAVFGLRHTPMHWLWINKHFYQQFNTKQKYFNRIPVGRVPSFQAIACS